MTTFPTERTFFRQNFQFPSEGEVVYENPPTFIWIPVEDAKKYELSIYDENKNLIETVETHKNCANPVNVLKTGKYYWKVKTENLERDFMEFHIAENALLFERPEAKELFDSYPTSRPSYLFEKKDIETLLKERPCELKALKKNVEIALECKELPKHPMHHRQGHEKEFRKYFADHRLFCDRDMVACALSYALTNDEKAGKKAKELMLEICDMNPYGPNSVEYSFCDEVGISNIRCLPPVFDMLYPILSDEERTYVATMISVYAQQCENVLLKIDYEKNPSHSHAGRIPAYLGGAALILKGTGVKDDETLIRWLKYSLDIYCGIFPFYGGNDGSWAEGPFYSASYTKWYLPFFSAVERFSGKSLFNRPFYHRYTNFLIHFCNYDHEIHPFGDGYWCDSFSEEWPGFFSQNPYIVYADKFGPDYAIKKRKEYSNQEFYYLHLLDLFLPTFTKEKNTLAKDPENVEVFPDSGFIAMHTDLHSADDICLFVRASRFPHDSHRHADQGSFSLISSGVALITPSGYYSGLGYGCRHHFEWTKNTKAHNTFIFSGHDQKSVDVLESVGKIVSVDKDKKHCVLDISSAYDNIDLWQRELTLEDNCLTVKDTVLSKEEVEVLYPLHTMAPPFEKDGKIYLERKGQKLEIDTGNLTVDQITDKYDVDLNQDVPEEYRIPMPQQYHIYLKSEKAKEHKFVVKFKIN